MQDYNLYYARPTLKDHSDSELPMVAIKGFVGTESHSSVSLYLTEVSLLSLLQVLILGYLPIVNHLYAKLHPRVCFLEEPDLNTV